MLIDGAYNRNHDNPVLNLSRSYIFSIGIDNCSILIKHKITINGNGWTVNALGYCRVFNITANNVTLNRLVISDGDANGTNKTDDLNIGGGIYWSGKNGQLINSTIRNCMAENGAGIYYAPSATDAKVSGCLFENNNATQHGGAIDCNATRMNLTNTAFISNYADYGAALCREREATGGFGYNNTFKSNIATTAGAALAWMNATHISINKYNFEDNVAGFSGGAIYVGHGSGNCEIYNSTFKNNRVTNNTDGHGGAIEWYAKEGIVSNSNFTKNTAYIGGAIYVGSDSGNITVIKSNFTENSATVNGGAISLDASSVTINESNFYNNTAQNGGAMYVGGVGLTNKIISSNFEGNVASNKDTHDGRGGAIDWVASSGTLYNTNFTRNYADYGGAVYMGGNSL